LAQFRAQRGDLEASLEDVRKIIDRRPGRVSAGKAAECGETFKIGEAYVYSFLSSYGFDELLPFSRWGRDTQPSIGDGSSRYLGDRGFDPRQLHQQITGS
jgi:hypothetical protein